MSSVLDITDSATRRVLETPGHAVRSYGREDWDTTRRPVVLVTGEYPPKAGGVGDYTRRLRDALARRGYRAQVITRVGGPSEAGVLRVVRSWGVGALTRLARAAPHGAVVHLQYQAAAFDLRGEVCLAPRFLRWRRPDLRFATTFHDVRVPYVLPKAGPARAWAVRLLAGFSDAVIAADAQDLAWLGGPSPRHHLVRIGSNVPARPPAGYERQRFRATLGLQPSDLAIAYFGFLNASKDVETLVAAFACVVSERPAKLLLLGGSVGGSDPTDVRTAASVAPALAALGAQTVRPGFLPPEDVSAYLLAADVALLPFREGASWRRGSLLACAEHRLPIVSTNGAGVDAELADALLACPPGDASCLADAVQRVADEPELRERLRAGSERLARLASWDRIADAHDAIYQALGE